MKVRKPIYYDEFSCIADNCPFTCCQEWKIGVDDNTKANWCNMNIPKCACERIGVSEDSKLISVVGVEDQPFVAGKVDSSDLNESSGDAIGVSIGESKDAGRGDCIMLDSSRKCPLLNEKGLCDVVLAYGEENISVTCHTFPRESHKYEGYTEKTLAMGCPAALDLLWNTDTFCCLDMSEEENNNEIKHNCACDTDCMDGSLETCDDELIEFRDALIELVDPDKSIEKAMKILFYIGLDCLEHDDVCIDDEIIWELDEKIDEFEVDLDSTYCEQNELFLDLCDNYRKKGIYKNVIDELANMAEGYEDSKSNQLVRDRSQFEEIMCGKMFSVPGSNLGIENTLEDMMRLLVQEEVYSSLLLPEGDMYSMVMKLQWIAITYAVIRQCLFLRWKVRGKLEYEDIREIVNVIIRMTGYSEADIEEYLENSFEEVIWDWGYMALILG